MSSENEVNLIGNMGSKARMIEKDDKMFAAFSLATQGSYKDANEVWQKKEVIWHNVLVFSKKTLNKVKSLKSGSRIKVQGELSYRAFDVPGPDGQALVKNEASVIASSIDQAPL